MVNNNGNGIYLKIAVCAPHHAQKAERTHAMSSTTSRKRTSAATAKAKTVKTEVKRPQRKATFTVVKRKGVLVFTAVNKRAHKLAKLVGKRTKLTSAELKTALEKRPNMHPYAYTSTGTLTPVKFKG